MLQAESLLRLGAESFIDIVGSEPLGSDVLSERAVVLFDDLRCVVVCFDGDFESWGAAVLRLYRHLHRLPSEVVVAVSGQVPLVDLGRFELAASSMASNLWVREGREVRRVQERAGGWAVTFENSGPIASPFDLSEYPDVRVATFSDGARVEYLGLEVASYDFLGHSDVGVSIRDQQSRDLGLGPNYDRKQEFERCLAEVMMRRRPSSLHPIATLHPDRWMREAWIGGFPVGSVKYLEIGSFVEPQRRCYALGGLEKPALVAFGFSGDILGVFEALGLFAQGVRDGLWTKDSDLLFVRSANDPMQYLSRLLGEIELSTRLQVVEEDWRQREVVGTRCS